MFVNERISFVFVLIFMMEAKLHSSSMPDRGSEIFRPQGTPPTNAVYRFVWVCLTVKSIYQDVMGVPCLNRGTKYQRGGATGNPKVVGSTQPGQCGRV